jgi:hypothetical protein
MTNIGEILPQLFRFRPWPQGDPVAPWVIDQLDKNQLVSLAQAGLEFNQSVLQAQLKANAQALDIIKGVQRK